MNAGQVFWQGLRRSTQYWQILVILWFGELLLAALLALSPALKLLGPAHLTAFQDAARGIPDWMVFELLASFYRIQSASGLDLIPGFDRAFLATILDWLILIPPVAWLSSSFLFGGMLDQYTRQDEAFRLRTFFSNCWSWWGKFLVIGLFQALIGLLVAVIGVIFLVLAFSLSLLAGILVLFLFALIAGLWLAFFELTRVNLVVGVDHSIFHSFSRSARLLWHRPWLLFGYYLLALLTLLAIHLFFQLGIFPMMPLAAWALVLPLQQSFIFLRLWSQAARYAGDVTFVAQ